LAALSPHLPRPAATTRAAAAKVGKRKGHVRVLAMPADAVKDGPVGAESPARMARKQNPD